VNDLIPVDHQVRIVWEYVQGLNLTPLLELVQATATQAGAPAIDPRILMSLWLYATLRGVGSARELDRRCDPELGEVPFQWICGEVGVNYHTLADFRAGHGDFLDTLLTQCVATLRHEGLVDLERVAQDGVKVRASAGTGSFRRRERLEEHLAEAEQQVRMLKEELRSDCSAASRRQLGSLRWGSDEAGTSGRSLDTAKAVRGVLRDVDGSRLQCGTKQCVPIMLLLTFVACSATSGSLSASSTRPDDSIQKRSFANG